MHKIKLIKPAGGGAHSRACIARTIRLCAMGCPLHKAQAGSLQNATRRRLPDAVYSSSSSISICHPLASPHAFARRQRQRLATFPMAAIASILPCSHAAVLIHSSPDECLGKQGPERLEKQGPTLGSLPHCDAPPVTPTTATVLLLGTPTPTTTMASFPCPRHSHSHHGVPPCPSRRQYHRGVLPLPFTAPLPGPFAWRLLLGGPELETPWRRAPPHY